MLPKCAKSDRVTPACPEFAEGLAIDDQLFLDNAEAHMAKEQEELIVRMNKIQPWVRICGAGSALLLVLITGIMLYSRFNI